MPGKPTRLSGLEARKQLLLAESELNRTHLLDDLQELKEAAQRIKDQTQSIGAAVSSVTKFAGTLLTIRRVFSRPKADGKKSWMSTLLKGAQVCASLWTARSR